MWAIAGMMLLHFAWSWLKTLSQGLQAAALIGGLLLALAIYRFGFLKLAKKNIQRVDAIPSERPCLFAFQQWTSYPLVVAMISIGIFLRKYSSLPKSLLTPMYLGIGGSLLLASTQYYKHLWVNALREKFGL